MADTDAKIRPLVAGNWKMNGLKAGLKEAEAVQDALAGPLAGLRADVMIAPPATLLMSMALSCGDGRVSFAGQDCHAKASGAHTGDVSAEMLAEAGASAVIVGHSERRADHGETSAIVRAKAQAAHRAGLAAIVCIGETAGERAAGLTLSVVRQQLAGSAPDGATAANLIIAYEPVWAIGTGLVPTLDDVAEVHAAIRHDLAERFGTEGRGMRILYGGSVKPDNAAALLSVADVNGALVGGASLKAADFLAILRAYAAWETLSPMRVHRSKKFLLAAMPLAIACALPAHATQPRIDAEACKEMRVEQIKFIESGILVDLSRGPEWGKANLSAEKLREIELFIMLDEQLKFGCRDAKISPDAARAGQAAIEIETPPAPPAEPPADPNAPLPPSFAPSLLSPAPPGGAEQPAKPAKKPKPAAEGQKPKPAKKLEDAFSVFP